MKLYVTKASEDRLIVAGSLKLNRDEDGNFPVPLNDRDKELVQKFISSEDEAAEKEQRKPKVCSKRKAEVKATEYITTVLEDYLTARIPRHCQDHDLGSMAHTTIELNRNRKTGKISFIRQYKPRRSGDA